VHAFRRAGVQETEAETPKRKEPYLDTLSRQRVQGSRSQKRGQKPSKNRFENKVLDREKLWDSSRKKAVRKKPKAKAKNHERSWRKTVPKTGFGDAFGKNFPGVIVWNRTGLQCQRFLKDMWCRIAERHLALGKWFTPEKIDHHVLLSDHGSTQEKIYYHILSYNQSRICSNRINLFLRKPGEQRERQIQTEFL